MHLPSSDSGRRVASSAPLREGPRTLHDAPHAPRRRAARAPAGPGTDDWRELREPGAARGVASAGLAGTASRRRLVVRHRHVIRRGRRPARRSSNSSSAGGRLCSLAAPLPGVPARGPSGAGRAGATPGSGPQELAKLAPCSGALPPPLRRTHGVASSSWRWRNAISVSSRKSPSSRCLIYGPRLHRQPNLLEPPTPTPLLSRGRVCPPLAGQPSTCVNLEAAFKAHK